MLRMLRQRMQSEEKGFTLIELLVVVLIIGILAAIAIPAFLGQREKAQDSDAKSDVRNAASAAGAYFSDGETYVGMDVAALEEVEPSLADATLAVGAAGASNYTLTATAKTGHTFTITRNANGTTSRSCTPVGGGGGCNNGNW